MEKEETLTPACALGFIERLERLLGAAGLHRRGYVGFLTEATGLSKSGANRILQDKRPPKRLKTFLQLANYLAQALTGHKGTSVKSDEVVEYLLNAKDIRSLPESNPYDISEFVHINPLLASQLIIRINELAKEHLPYCELSSGDIDKIQFRVISYAFKNSTDPDSLVIQNMVFSLFELAKDGLL